MNETRSGNRVLTRKKNLHSSIQLTWKSRCAGPISPGSSDWIQSCKGIEVTTDVHNPATKEGKKKFK